VRTQPKWEYQVLVTDGESDAATRLEELDGLGSEGWELTAIQGAWYIFKRPYRDEPEEEDYDDETDDEGDEDYDEDGTIRINPTPTGGLGGLRR